MLLKASDITRDELQLLEDLRLPPVLNLVRYHQLKDGMEFRGFVFNHALVGVCQRTPGASHVAELALSKARSLLSSSLVSFPQADCTL